MSEVVYKKLVRDKIPDIISNSGKTPEFRFLTDDEYFRCLKLKLLEECSEVLRANEKFEMLEELSDVMEVVNSLTVSLGFSAVELEDIRRKKFDSRGGFSQKIFLEKVLNND